MAYIGPEPNPGQNREVDDISSSFNGSLADFTLQVNSQNVSPGRSNNIIVSLGGVVQNPGTDYTVAASTLTFTTAPASGLSFFGLVLGQQVDIQSVADSASIVSPTLSGPTVTGDLSIADKIVHTGDTNTAIRFPAADTITAETGGSEGVRVDSSGRVGIGTTSPAAKLDIGGLTNTGGQNVDALKITRTDGLQLFGINWNVDANEVSFSGNTKNYVFKNKSSSAESIRFPATGGITFNGDTAAANALDDYEEGTFTPNISQGGSVSSYTIQRGSYTKIGDFVHCQIDLMLSGSSNSDAVKIGGLPFTSKNQATFAFGGAFIAYANAVFPRSGNDRVLFHVLSTSTEIKLHNEAGSALSGNATGVDVFSNREFLLVVSYKAS